MPTSTSLLPPSVYQKLVDEYGAWVNSQTEAGFLVTTEIGQTWIAQWVETNYDKPRRSPVLDIVDDGSEEYQGGPDL